MQQMPLQSCDAVIPCAYLKLSTASGLPDGLQASLCQAYAYAICSIDMLHCRRSQSLASVESPPDEALIAEGWIVAGTILSYRDYKPGKHTACWIL